jgi:hypothetical protein
VEYFAKEKIAKGGQELIKLVKHFRLTKYGMFHLDAF